MNLTVNDTQLALQLETLKKRIYECLNENRSHSYYEFSYPPPNGTLHVEDGLFCPKVFDGLLCWDDTPAGANAYQNCPGNIEGFNPAQMAYKMCLTNGTWFKHPVSNLIWTNLTTCIDYDDFAFRVLVNDISVVGYCLSFAILIVAMFIFYYHGLVSNTRTRVHFHLFMSLAISSALWIVYYKALIVTEVYGVYPWLCHALYALNVYFMVTSYFWMFCESVHIYRSLVPVLGEGVGLPLFTCYMISSWGTPVLLTAAHVYLRFYTGPERGCLITTSPANYVLSIPAFCFFIISFYFFIRIMWVIIRKAMNAPGIDGIRPVSAATPTFKSAVILILVFGLHFLLMPVQPMIGTDEEKVYAFCCSTITSNQGTLVAIALCFCNREAMNKVKDTFQRRRRLRQELQQITAATGGESIQIAEQAF